MQKKPLDYKLKRASSLNEAQVLKSSRQKLNDFNLPFIKQIQRK